MRYTTEEAMMAYLDKPNNCSSDRVCEHDKVKQPACTTPLQSLYDVEANEMLHHVCARSTHRMGSSLVEKSCDCGLEFGILSAAPAAVVQSILLASESL